MRGELKKKEIVLSLPSKDLEKNFETKPSPNGKAKEMLYSVGRWVKNNPGKTVGYGVLGAIGADALWRSGNEFIRLPIIYKTPKDANKFRAGSGASSVVEVVKRFGGTDKRLTEKQMERFFSTSCLMGCFDSEVLACKKLSEWQKDPKNSDIFKNIAKVIDYHYGLRDLYVIYEEAEDKDWKNEMAGADYKQKISWLHKVCRQVLDVALF